MAHPRRSDHGYMYPYVHFLWLDDIWLLVVVNIIIILTTVRSTGRTSFHPLCILVCVLDWSIAVSCRTCSNPHLLTSAGMLVYRLRFFAGDASSTRLSSSEGGGSDLDGLTLPLICRFVI
jgi:hypothetical protein